MTKASANSDTLRQLAEISTAAAFEEMASGFTHELSQPLAAIATFSHAGERMLTRPEPWVDRALDVFGQIAHEALVAGDRLQSLRRHFEHARVPRTRCRVSELLAELRPVLHSLSASVDAELQIDAPEAAPEVRVDRLRIQHVLMALMQNAVEASVTASGASVIRIDVRAERYVVETGISDGGGGVSEEARARLFRPFFSTKTNGRGLGLASSRAIIEAHEGTMGSQNLPAGGARFWLRLPIALD